MSAEPKPSLSIESAKPLVSPPPSYSPGSGLALDPPEHLHAPLTLQQDIQYHQLFTRPATQVDITLPGLPVAQAVETYVDDDEIKSNDPKLANVDLLYDYFRLKAAEPIRMQVLVHGSHTETQVYYTTRINPHNNQREQVRQTRTITITDFDFTVPVLPLSSGQPTEVTFSTAIDSHPAKWKLRDAEKWKKRNGLPGWADEAVTRQLYNAKNPTDPLESPLVPNEEAEQGASSPGCDKDLEKGLPILRAGAVQASPERALKELCQQYAADPGRLKEIEMKVGVWGWDLERLENAIENCVRATGYSSAIAISFNHTPRRYIVRPFNRLTQLKRNVWLMIVACITLVYPVIWLFLRATGKNGKKYNTIRADHALKTYVPVPDTFPGEALTQACTRLQPNSEPSNADHDSAHRDLVTGPLGVYALAGQKEGAWMHKWEAKIKDAARSRYRGDLSETTGVGVSVIGNGLDGY